MATIHHNPEIIRSWREAAALTQEQLAEEIRRSRPTIARTEDATVPVSLDVLASIAAYYKKPLADALNEEGRRKYGIAINDSGPPQ